MIEEKESVAKVQRSSGIFRFQVEGYSGVSTRIGDSIESPEFGLCGYTWQLRIFPGGSLEAHKGYLSFYLASKSNQVARATYKLSVINQMIGGEDESFSSSGVRIFEAKGVQVDGWGRDKFMLAPMLKEPSLGYRVNDTVVFKVDITVFGDLEASVVLDSRYAGHASRSLDACLRSMFNDRATADTEVILTSSNDCLHVHRCILAARSDVFRAMFASNYREQRCGQVLVPDIDTAVMRELLLHIYTDCLPDRAFLAEHAWALLAGALKYQLPALIEACEVFLVAQLEPEGAPALLSYADSICCATLKRKMLLYIAQHSGQVLQLKEYQELDDGLQAEANAMIDYINKRRGCRGAAERERRMSFGCAIM